MWKPHGKNDSPIFIFFKADSRIVCISSHLHHVLFKLSWQWLECYQVMSSSIGRFCVILDVQLTSNVQVKWLFLNLSTNVHLKQQKMLCWILASILRASLVIYLRYTWILRINILFFSFSKPPLCIDSVLFHNALSFSLAAVLQNIFGMNTHLLAVPQTFIRLYILFLFNCPSLLYKCMFLPVSFQWIVVTTLNFLH